MAINIIVAAGKDGAIGKEGNLIWRLSADLKRFKALTMGHPVIMGRKTWESLPKKPLPGRRNIVVTHDSNYAAPGAEVVSSPEEALRLCNDGDPFIIGGQQIYKALLPYATRIYLTHVDEECLDADAHFPALAEFWKVVEADPPEFTPEGVKYQFRLL